MSLYAFSAIRTCGRGITSLQKIQLPLLARAYSAAALDEHSCEKRVLDVLSCFSKIDQSKLTKDAHFMKDLGLNSLDAVEIVMILEEEFHIEIPDDHAEKILSAQDAIKYILTNPNAA